MLLISCYKYRTYKS